MKQVFLLLGLVLLFAFLCHHEHRANPFAQRWTPHSRNQLYAMLDVLALRLPRQQWFACFGTLLGAVRDGDVIQWDDDADVCVDKHLNIDALLANTGLVVDRSCPVVPIKVYWPHGQPIPGVSWRWPFVDLFYYSQTDSLVTIEEPPKTHDYPHTDIFPLQQLRFGGMTARLPVPNKPVLMLNKMYGPNCLSECVSSSYAHVSEKPIYPRPEKQPCPKTKFTSLKELPVYLINLDRRKDRLQSSERQLQKLGLAAERVSALDAKQNTQMYERIAQPKVRPTELACSLSHVDALRRFLNTGLPHALVFEDDILIPDSVSESDILDVLNSSVNADIVLIGHCYSRTTISDISQQCSAVCLHAYCVNRRAAATIIGAVNTKEAIDVTVRRLSDEHRLRCFCAQGDEGLIYQNDAFESDNKK